MPIYYRFAVVDKNNNVYPLTHKDESKAYLAQDQGSVCVDLCGNFHMKDPWGDWYAIALASGVDQPLALLGMWVYKTSKKRDWKKALKKECGWSDNGREMLKLAKNSPDKASERWNYLMDSVGEKSPIKDKPSRNKGPKPQILTDEDWDNVDKVFSAIVEIKRKVRERMKT